MNELNPSMVQMTSFARLRMDQNTTGGRRQAAIAVQSLSAIAVGLLVVSWLGVNAVWGLTSEHDTLISGWQRGIAPLGYWVAASFGFLSLAFVAAAIGHQKALTWLVAMLLAYLLGVLGARYAHVWIDPPFGVPFRAWIDLPYALFERSFLLLPAIPMTVVYWLSRSSAHDGALGFGDWKITTRMFSSRENAKSWAVQLVRVTVFGILPVAVLMQGTVGFAPILTGRLMWLLVPVASLALLNGFAEELLFRGLIQSGLVRLLGPGLGVWLQAAFFGIHHWGASPVPGFATALVAMLLGVVWGKSVLATKGLGWAVCCHALVDLSFFAAHFVDTG